jgi:hypothetical protein
MPALSAAPSPSFYLDCSVTHFLLLMLLLLLLLLLLC